MPEFEIITVDETPYLYVERSCTREPAEIADAMGSAFGEVWDFLQAHDITPAGGALSVYYNYAPDQMDFRAGFTVSKSDMDKAGGAVKADVTPGGTVVHGTHKGPYSGLKASYGEMYNFVQANEVQFTAPTWEIYLNSPDQVPEDQLITELYQALA